MRKGLRRKKRTKRGSGREHEERGRVASKIVKGMVGSRGRVGVKESLCKQLQSKYWTRIHCIRMRAGPIVSAIPRPYYFKNLRGPGIGVSNS